MHSDALSEVHAQTHVALAKCLLNTFTTYMYHTNTNTKLATIVVCRSPTDLHLLLQVTHMGQANINSSHSILSMTGVPDPDRLVSIMAATSSGKLCGER